MPSHRPPATRYPSRLWLGLMAAAVTGIVVPPVVRGLVALGTAEALHEWECPNCGATTRARMADQ